MVGSEHDPEIRDRSAPLNERSRGESTLETKVPKLLSRISNTTKRGYSHADFSFLLPFVPEERARRIAEAAASFIPSNRSFQEIYVVVNVLKQWCVDEDHRQGLWIMDPNAFARAVKATRRKWYHKQTATRHFQHVNSDWALFTRFLEHLAMRNLIPHLPYRTRAFGHLKVGNRRALAPRTLVDRSIDPYAVAVGCQGYLLEPMSISAPDEVYLDQYEQRLGAACAAFVKAATEEFEALVRMHGEGRRAIAGTDWKYLSAQCKDIEFRGINSHVDASSGERLFSPTHPNFLGNVLTVIQQELGGLPRLSPESSDTPTLIANAHWCDRILARINREELIPYLGLLWTESIPALLTILLLENPCLNVDSLFEAMLEDEYGSTILLSTAGEGNALRLTVDKPRAREQRSVVLKGLSLRVIEHVLEWTAPLRAYLKSKGSSEARKFWIAIPFREYEPIHPARAVVTYFAFKAGVNSNGPNSTRGVRMGKRGRSSFVKRHLELAPWATSATLKALRVSAGVLIWFQSGGDLDATARAFGHKNIRTTITCYIPAAIQRAMYTRQIRRFQNLLICAATAGQPYQLAATDFTTLEELHSFLAQLLESPDGQTGNPLLDHIRQHQNYHWPQATGPSDASIEPEHARSAEILVSSSPNRLALLLLYREALLDRHPPPAVLDQPDLDTHTSPRLWLDLGNVIFGDLPDELCAFSEPIGRARLLADTLRGQLHFPSLSRLP